jgi:hypothetical protein
MRLFWRLVSACNLDASAILSNRYGLQIMRFKQPEEIYRGNCYSLAWIEEY